MSTSGTSYTSQSVFTVTDSLKERLVEEKDGHLYSAVASHYHLPYDPSVSSCEVLVHQFSQLLHNGEATCITEPEGHEGELESVLRRGGRVLDIGCGMQGVWVVQMCEAFERAEVVGVDLFPVERDYAPPNAIFEVSDVVDEGCLLYPDEYFDLVHCRYTLPWLNPLKNTFILNEIKRVLKPGGILLLEEAMAELTGAHKERRVPCWLHREHPNGQFLWPAIFRMLEPLIRSSGRDETEDGYGWFDEVVELKKRIHVGRQSRPAVLDGLDPTELKETLLHRILEDQFRTPARGDLDEDAVQPRLPDPTVLAKVDSGLWQEYSLIWAKKSGVRASDGPAEALF